MKVQGVLFLLWVIMFAFWLLNQFNAAHRRAEKEKKLKDSLSI
jgi:hypothetical protein